MSRKTVNRCGGVVLLHGLKDAGNGVPAAGATDSAKSGDTAPIAAAAAMILLAGAGFIARKRGE